METCLSGLFLLSPAAVLHHLSLVAELSHSIIRKTLSGINNPLKRCHPKRNYNAGVVIGIKPQTTKKRVCQNTLFITEDRYIAEHSYEVAI